MDEPHEEAESLPGVQAVRLDGQEMNYGKRALRILDSERIGIEPITVARMKASGRPNGREMFRVCADCGNKGDTEAHHPDYRNPNDIAWLCRRCHGGRHTTDKYSGRGHLSTIGVY